MSANARTLFLIGLVVGIAFTVAVWLARPRTVLAPGDAGEASDDTDRRPGDGTNIAPEDYPVKGNGRSGIYHLPGDLAYERTIATDVFRTSDAAERAGFRHAKA